VSNEQAIKKNKKGEGRDKQKCSGNHC